MVAALLAVKVGWMSDCFGALMKKLLKNMTDERVEPVRHFAFHYVVMRATATGRCDVCPPRCEQKEWSGAVKSHVRIFSFMS